MAGRIFLAGRIAAVVDGHRADERTLPGGQARLALALLVCLRQRPVSRDELAENLWPSQRPRTWEPALRGVVGRVRGFLISAGLGDAGVVRASAGAYHVHLPTDLEVDIERASSDTLEAENALVAQEPALAQELASGARALLGRPFLPGVDAPWLSDKRRELSGLHVRALEALAEARLVLGESRHAATAAQEAIALDGFRESAHRLLIRAHVQAGEVAEALLAYERCRQLLATELGASPAPETQALHTAVLRDGAPPEQTVRPPSERSRSPARRDVCPYRGLRMFEEDDADLFFGRSADVSRLLERLEARRFLAVAGPSGSGKSSLVRAGLVPALRRGALPGSDTWQVRVFRPGTVPLKALARELVQLEPELDEEAIVEQLLDDEDTLHHLVEAVGRDDPQVSRLVLVVDQLEEVFSLCEDEAQRHAFLAALVAASTTPQGDTMVIVTLRADYYPRLAEHPRLADLASAAQFLVAPMDEVGLADAIEGPARAVGLRVEDGLTETILRDLARRPGSLPLLGHCLLELWERRADGTLTLAAYLAAGGVSSALAQRADAVYLGLSVDQQAVARQVLLRLTQPGEGADDTRRRVAFSELLTDLAQRERVEGVVARLTEARLLTTGGPPTEERWVEVSHEALIREWPRLHRWVEDDRAGLRIHRRLTAAATEWERLDRDEGALYRGAQLAEAAGWAERHPGFANPVERAFLEGSLAAEDAQRRHRRHRLQLVAASLAIGLVVASALAVTASVQRSEAQEQQRLALSRGVAAEAVNQLSIEPGLGLTLAIEAVEIATTREAVAALRHALITPHPRLEVAGGRRDFALDPTGRHLAVGAEDGTVRVWELGSGELLATLGGHAGPVWVTSFSPDGRRLVTTDEAGAYLWDVADGARRHHLPHETSVFGVAWDPDGGQVVTAGLADVIHVWDTGSGGQVATLAAPATVSFVRLAPDGRTLLAWSAVDPQLFVLDLETGDEIAVLDAHGAAAVDARVSPDGRHAISVGLDATARLWTLPDGEEVAVVEGFADRVWVGRFSSDGSLAIIGDSLGTVRVVEVPSGRTRFELAAHADAVVGAAFSPDDTVAVTVSLDGTALVWDIADGQPRDVLPLNGAAALGIETSSVLFTPDGQQVLTRAATVQAWDVPPGPDLELQGHERLVGTLALSPDGGLLATGSADGTLRLWNVDDGEPLQVLELPGSAMSAASFSSDGSQLVTANPFQAAVSDHGIPPTIWDVATGRQHATLPVPAPTGPPCPQVCQTNVVTHSPDDDLLATAGQEGVVRLWDAHSGEPAGALEPVDGQLRDLEFSPDGRWLAGAAWQRVPIWDTDTGEVVHELAAPGMAVAFDPSGDRLAVAGDDGITTIWAPAPGRLVGELRHASSVADVVWSRDGRFLLTAAGDGAHLWDVGSQQRIQQFGVYGGAHAVAFTPDDAIVTGAADGTVRFHRCVVCGPVEELLDAARRRAIRELSPVERQRFLQEVATVPAGAEG